MWVKSSQHNNGFNYPIGLKDEIKPKFSVSGAVSGLKGFAVG